MAKKTKSQKANGNGAVRAKQPKDDLIMTIDSDSENEAPVEEPSDEEEEEKPKDDENKEHDDINPNFQFSLDGFETTNTADGWDFRVAEEKTENKRKDVNLDDILRSKGGLTGLVGGEEAEEEEEEEEDEEEEDDDEEVEEDDDELALDGFGMNAQSGDEEEEEEEQVEEEEEEPVSDNEDSDEDEDKDSAEAIAKFYEKAEESQTHTTFQTLDLSRPVLKGLANLGYTKPSPIQSASIPIALMGKDIVAGAVTGSGKTAAYMIPVIERLLFKPTKVASTRVIVLTPTRELAIQVCDVGKKIGRFINNLSLGLAVGGLNLRQQEQQLKTRPDIVVATPGRLIDHIRNSASFSLDALEILIMDEADRMLEEGFQAELTEILTLIPKHQRQTMLFSATMNTKIQDLIQLSLNKPVRIMIDPPKAAATKLVQEFVRIRKKEEMKPALLFHLLKLLDPAQQNRTVVFVSRKETAHKLRIILGLLGMKVSELHGSLSQEQRLNNVSDFKNLTVPVLICTDLAARGLDIPKIEMVVNYDMPKTHEIYLHRVGRTARAGREGRSITFVGEATADRNIVKAAIKSLENDGKKNGKAVSRNVEWDEVEKIQKVVEEKKDVVDEVLAEEKSQKELLTAEMELAKADNLMKYGKEIQSRPKRTWFETEAEKRKHQSEAMQQLTKNKHNLNAKKRKQKEGKEDGGRSWKKTKTVRMAGQGKPRNSGSGKKNKKKH
ncbi:uncharacterized protein CXQ87_003593 [Candidozyma duobushaemuli]|uniref:RNA helicase n=2 Tax=Candidozyma TaxID=3303203 RepID=A0ABX8IAN5_9ASCO|nr:uncharacterized protein CXQ87_003593 [[Candida] duobushaemulonis]PVH15744.1 hypothetical protein CXQ87_003593 [[Candida] duobushaemulonis]QWU88923.1 hypothetical protein CA3LBN_003231 [[Candida] haemuloni]